jgi:hypothetical protein
MDLPIVTMDRRAALDHVRAYHAAVHARHEQDRQEVERKLEKLSEEDRRARLQIAQEDEALLRGYRALARGKRVLSLTQAMQQAGLDAAGWPRLGIARADQIEIQCREASGGFTFGPSRNWDGRTADSKVFSVNLPHQASASRAWRADHDVPRVPAPLRPAADLSNYAILFEATSWRFQNQRVRRGGDPALLKHLGGDLFAVLAVWDLTAIEAAVLGLTAS